MIEIVAQLSAGAVQAPPPAEPPAKPVEVDPADVKTFSLMMDEGVASAAPHPVAGGEVSELARTVITQGTEFSDRFQTLDAKRADLVNDMNDPMMAMARAADFQAESTALFTHLNLASGLATAVTSSFNSLFKNQS